jgi:hypothetical protein
MKKTVLKIQLLYVLIALAFMPSLARAASDIIFGPDGTEASIGNNDGTWINMWGPAFINTYFDTTNPPPSGDIQGSVYNDGDWTGDTSGMDDYNDISPGTWFGAVNFDGSQYTSIQFDFKFDTNSTMTPNSARHLNVGFDQQYDFVYMTNLDLSSDSTLCDGNWHHVIVPVTIAAFTTAGANPANCYGVSRYCWNPGGTSGTMNYWMANVHLFAAVVPAPPPTMSISTPVKGLHFVEGSISGQFDRQNIITANGANSSANYSWAGVATAQNPVTYSVTISQYTAPQLNYHIFLYQTAGAGNASAPDYNQPNVVDLQVAPTANNTEAIVSVFWKTNSPNSGLPNTVLDVTNPVLTGTYSLQFTSNNGGNVLAPGGNSYPFTLDPSLATLLVNPITVNFGILPFTSNASEVGQEVVVSSASITGVSPLSVNYNTTDNFLTDSSLDTNTWTVNALDVPSVWFVSASDKYAVSWTIPDSEFSLIASTNLFNLSASPSLAVPAVLLTPGKRALIPSSDLPGAKLGFFALVQRAPYQLQVLLPGETNAPDTVTGKIGTPIAQSDSTETMITINMCDQNWNIVNSSDTVHITSTDEAADLPNDTGLSNGTLTEGMFFGSTGSFTVTASDDNNTTILSNTSSSVTVGP